MLPYLSTTQDGGGDADAQLGKWQLPLSSGTVELLRRGQPFWEVLEGRGVADHDHPHAGELPAVGHGDARAERHGHARPARHLRHVLVLHVGAVCLRRPDAVGRRRSTSRRLRRRRRGEARRARQPVPARSPRRCSADFTVYLDRCQPVAKIVVGGEERLLRVGEWSDWVPVDFRPGRRRRPGGRGAVLPEGSRSVLRALRQPGQHRSARTRVAVSTPETTPRSWRAATGRFYTPGHARGHQGLQDRRAHRRGVPGAGPDRGEENLRQYRTSSINSTAGCCSTTSATSIRSRT